MTWRTRLNRVNSASFSAPLVAAARRSGPSFTSEARSRSAQASVPLHTNITRHKRQQQSKQTSVPQAHAPKTHDKAKTTSMKAQCINKTNQTNCPPPSPPGKKRKRHRSTPRHHSRHTCFCVCLGWKSHERKAVFDKQLEHLTTAKHGVVSQRGEVGRQLRNANHQLPQVSSNHRFHAIERALHLWAQTTSTWGTFCTGHDQNATAHGSC